MDKFLIKNFLCTGSTRRNFLSANFSHINQNYGERERKKRKEKKEGKEEGEDEEKGEEGRGKEERKKERKKRKKINEVYLILKWK